MLPPSLPALAAVLARARVAIGPSTGPLHLAASAGTPVVGLYPRLLSQNPARWGPRGPVVRILQPPFDTRLAHPMDAIPVDDVVAAAAGIVGP